MTTKVQIAFSPLDLERIERCRAASGGTTLARVVRDALTFAAWVARARAEGWTLVAIKGDRVKEIVQP